VEFVEEGDVGEGADSKDDDFIGILREYSGIKLRFM
jgi:hypothetical protein